MTTKLNDRSSGDGKFRIITKTRRSHLDPLVGRKGQSGGNYRAYPDLSFVALRDPWWYPESFTPVQ